MSPSIEQNDSLDYQESPLPGDRQSIFSMPAAFVAGLLLVLTAISLLPIPQARRYASLEGDMRRLSAIRQRIQDDPTPIDIAFIGTSHTWNAVADQDLQRRLVNMGTHLSVANLGASWMGRDMHFFLLKELLESKHPRLVVIEIDEHEYAFGHLALPYVAEVSDLFCCKPYLDPQFPGHFGLYLKNQVVNGVDWMRHSETPVSSDPAGEFGWVALDQKWKNPTLNTQTQTLRQRLKYQAFAMTSFYGLGVVQQMFRLAQEKGANVVFLYLPVYEHAQKDPAVGLSSYTDLAPTIRLPLNIAKDPAFWANESHLNRDGAMALTAILAEKIQAQLVPHAAAKEAIYSSATMISPCAETKRICYRAEVPRIRSASLCLVTNRKINFHDLGLCGAHIYGESHARLFNTDARRHSRAQTGCAIKQRGLQRSQRHCRFLSL